MYNYIENFFNKINIYDPNDPYQAEFILKEWRKYNPLCIKNNIKNFIFHPIKIIINFVIIKRRNKIINDKRFKNVKLAFNCLYNEYEL